MRRGDDDPTTIYDRDEEPTVNDRTVLVRASGTAPCAVDDADESAERRTLERGVANSAQRPTVNYVVPSAAERRTLEYDVADATKRRTLEYGVAETAKRRTLEYGVVPRPKRLEPINELELALYTLGLDESAAA